MKAKTLVPILFAFLLLVVSSYSAVTITDTYGIINSDEAIVSSVVSYGGNIYFLMNGAIYKYNITERTYSKVFDMGFAYIGTTLLFSNGYFYLTGYKLYNDVAGNPGEGGTPIFPPEFHPVCPLPTDRNYWIGNFTVWKLSSSDFTVVGSTQKTMLLYAGQYQMAVRGSKLLSDGSNLYLYVTGYDNKTSMQGRTIVFKVDISNGYTEELNLTERTMDAFYHDSFYLLSEHGKVYKYDNSFVLEKEYGDSIYSMHMQQIWVDDNYVYIVGNGVDPNGNYGGVLEVLTKNLTSIVYSHFYSEIPILTAVRSFNDTALIGYKFTIWQVNFKKNVITSVYTNDMGYVYDINKGVYSDKSTVNGRMRFIEVFKNVTGEYKIVYGGYYVENYMMYAWLVSNDKPSTWMTEISSGGGFFVPTENNFYFYVGVAIGLLIAVLVVRNRKRWYR